MIIELDTLHITLLFLLFLFISIWFTIANFGNIYQGNAVTRLNIMIQSAAITGLTYMILVY